MQVDYRKKILFNQKVLDLMKLNLTTEEYNKLIYLIKLLPYDTLTNIMLNVYQIKNIQIEI
jgi:hypothetical protein